MKPAKKPSVVRIAGVFATFATKKRTPKAVLSLPSLQYNVGCADCPCRLQSWTTMKSVIKLLSLLVCPVAGQNQLYLRIDLPKALRNSANSAFSAFLSLKSELTRRFARKATSVQFASVHSVFRPLNCIAEPASSLMATSKETIGHAVSATKRCLHSVKGIVGKDDHMVAHRMEMPNGIRGPQRGNAQDYRGDDYVSPNNYEVGSRQELLKLDGEKYIPGQGMSASDVNRIPTTIYAGEDDMCAICKETINKGQKVRILPCSHLFHSPCIDSWLVRSPRCPIDNLPLVPNNP